MKRRANKRRGQSKARQEDGPARKSQRLQQQSGDNAETVERVQLLGAMEEDQAPSSSSQKGEKSSHVMPRVEDIIDFDKVWGNEIALDDSGIIKEVGNKDSSSLSLGCDQDIDLLRCGNDDITSHVPLSLKQRIWQNQYINIALLLRVVQN